MFRKRVRDPLVVKPSILAFEEITLIESGKFELNLLNHKLNLARNDEISAHKFHMEGSQLYNIAEGTRFIKMTTLDDSSPCHYSFQEM